MECPEEIKKSITIALAGNPNVGKSVVFNQLTGLSQTIGNWPGKTVKKAEGKTYFHDYEFRIIDLPGIYNLSTYSLEEIIAREYVINEKPDYVINVIDANRFERNLFFTLQLLMLNCNVIICLNQFDLLKRRGYDIDVEKMSELLGVPVVPTIAIHNRGIHELLEEIIKMDKQEKEETDIARQNIHNFQFGKEIEEKVQAIERLLNKKKYINKINSPRFAAIKLLEGDEHCTKELFNKNDDSTPKSEEHILNEVEDARVKLEQMHGEQISSILNSELFQIADKIEKQTLILNKDQKGFKWVDLIDHITIHSFFGYILLALILLGVYTAVFEFGGWISGLVDGLFESWTPAALEFFGGEDTWTFKIFWSGLFGSFMGGVGGVLPFVIPFFLIIEILQDIGYLPRAAYLMDNFMHKLGIHGKSIIPILLGFGCNVPAMTASSIMETQKDKRRSILISSMIPCSAVSIIVMGLVAANHGIGLALLLYVVNFVMIIVIGRILTKIDTGDITELIIEIHDFRRPNLKVTLKQTWHRAKEFVIIALPLIILLGGGMEILLELGIVDPINAALSPIIVYFLGLPIGVGVYLFYGVLRKELNLVLLELYVASLGLQMVEYMSPIQMVVFSIITMLYVPCLATIITIGNEVGHKYATHLSLFQVVIALVIGGLLNWLYRLIEALNISFLITDIQMVIATFVIFFILIGIFLVLVERTKLVKKISEGRKYHLLPIGSENICVPEENKCATCPRHPAHRGNHHKKTANNR
ncbi:MAG: ferrous iron transport protein B [Candidatus Lokiarchaeota archaeon]|nr:ferrous iron transport protein B [Candidatus Lokiarchaeota archaeon]